MLFWAMLLLFVETVGRLLCWSLVIFIPLSVVHAWTVGSPMRWTITILTLALGLFFWFYWAKLRAGDRAKTAWLLVVLLISLSLILDHTETGLGYSIFNQPTARLIGLVMTASVFMTLIVVWRLTDWRARYARIGLAPGVAYSLLTFLPGCWGNAPVRQLFTPIGVLAGLPWYLQPAGFAVCIVLPLSVFAGVADSVQSLAIGDPPQVRERWFEYSCIVLAIFCGLITFSRLQTTL